MLSTFRNRNNKHLRHLPTGQGSRHVTVNGNDQLVTQMIVSFFAGFHKNEKRQLIFRIIVRCNADKL